MPRGLDAQPQQPASRRRRQPALTTPRADAPPVQLLQHPRQPPAGAAAAATAGTQPPAPPPPRQQTARPNAPRQPGRRKAPALQQAPPSQPPARLSAALQQPPTSHGQAPQAPQSAQRPRPQLRQRPPPPPPQPQGGPATAQAPQSSARGRAPAAAAAPPLPPAEQMRALLGSAADKSAAQVPSLGVPNFGQRVEPELILCEAWRVPTRCLSAQNSAVHTVQDARLVLPATVFCCMCSLHARLRWRASQRCWRRQKAPPPPPDSWRPHGAVRCRCCGTARPRCAALQCRCWAASARSPPIHPPRPQVRGRFQAGALSTCSAPICSSCG